MLMHFSGPEFQFYQARRTGGNWFPDGHMQMQESFPTPILASMVQDSIGPSQAHKFFLKKIYLDGLGRELNFCI